MRPNYKPVIVPEPIVRPVLVMNERGKKLKRYEVTFARFNIDPKFEFSDELFRVVRSTIRLYQKAEIGHFAAAGFMTKGQANQVIRAMTRVAEQCQRLIDQAWDAELRTREASA